MIRRRLGIFEATDEALRLLPILAGNPELEIVLIYDAHPASARQRAQAISPEVADEVDGKLVDDADAFVSRGRFDAVIDASGREAFTRRFATAAERGIEVVTPLTARLLWSYGGAGRGREERRAELLQALSEVVESAEMTEDSDELFERMLEIAMGVTGADGGSLMLCDPEGEALTVRVAIGIEPELWRKIRVPRGTAIAGRVLEGDEPRVIRGPADSQSYPGVRARHDVASALCLPLIDEGRRLGVLNLRHSTRRDAFDDEDLGFVEQLAALDAQIVARAEQQEQLRERAARYTTAHDVREILGTNDPLAERLKHFCRYCAEQCGRGVAVLYLRDPDDDELRLGATSLEGGGYAGEYRIAYGEGVDGRAAQTRTPILLRDERGALAYAALPLVEDGRLIGLLSLQIGDQTDGCDRRLDQALSEMTAALAEGIANVNRAERAALRATRLSAINEAGIQMLSAETLSDVVRLASSSVALILDAEHVVLRLRDPKTRRFVIRSYFGPADGRQQEQLFRCDKQVSLEALRRGEALLVRDLPGDPRFAEIADAGPRSLVCAPLREGAELVGSLAIYDKVAADQFFAGRFNDEDREVFERYVSYAERAVSAAGIRSEARRTRGVDAETELPNRSVVLQRLREEIARAGPRRDALAVALCRVENTDELEAAAGDAHRREVLRKTAAAMRDALREFDVLGRFSRDELLAVLPEPGGRAADRIYAIARATADSVAKDEELNRRVRVALAFGYAALHDDGADADTLIERAREPRIRMI